MKSGKEKQIADKQKAHSQEWAFCVEAGAGSGNRTRIISLEG